MIDLENLIYTKVRAAVLEYDANVDMSGEYVDVPAKFPHICFEMSDSSVAQRYMTAQEREFASDQTFTVNIFTNTPSKMQDARKLADVVDEEMSGLGFRRAMRLPTPNAERSIYRLTLRYDGTISKGYDGRDGHFNISAR